MCEKTGQHAAHAAAAQFAGLLLHAVTSGTRCTNPRRMGYVFFAQCLAVGAVCLPLIACACLNARSLSRIQVLVEKSIVTYVYVCGVVPTDLGVAQHVASRLLSFDAQYHSDRRRQASDTPSPPPSTLEVRAPPFARQVHPVTFYILAESLK